MCQIDSMSRERMRDEDVYSTMFEHNTYSHTVVDDGIQTYIQENKQYDGKQGNNTRGYSVK